VTSDSLIISNNDARIRNNDATGRIILSNSSTNTFAIFYGTSHPTNANQTVFANGGVTTCTFSSVGTATFSSSVTSSLFGFNALGAYGFTSYEGSSASGKSVVFTLAYYNGFDAIFQSAGNTNDFGIWTNGGTSTQAKLYIKNNGNVLIGTSTDAGQKLQVSGLFAVNVGSTSSFGFAVNVNSSFVFGSTNGRRTTTITSDSGDKPGLQFGYDTTANTGIIAAATESLGAGIDFYTYNGSAWGRRMLISKDGPILLGSTTNYVQVGNDGGGVYMETVGNENARRSIRIQTGNSNFTLYSAIAVNGANQIVSISTSNTDRIRVTSIGAINILDSYFLANSSGGYRFNNQADTFNNFIILDNGNATLRGTLTQNASDERLKNNIKIIPNAINKIKQLRGVTFEWNKELYETSRTTDIGVIAQDVQQVLSDAVSLAPFDTNSIDYTSKSGQNYLTVYYEKLIPLLIEGIKEQQKQIEFLKSTLQRNNIL
jgi:hypothetical protein